MHKKQIRNTGSAKLGENDPDPDQGQNPHDSFIKVLRLTLLTAVFLIRVNINRIRMRVIFTESGCGSIIHRIRMRVNNRIRMRVDIRDKDPIFFLGSGSG